MKIRYQYSNHLGSASLELNDVGEFVSYQEYFPFGETAYTYGTVSTEYRFTGKERDEFTGLYYFGARYYAPWMFRWMSPDPSGPVDGLNVFVYCSNRPIVMVDPDGRKSIAALQQDLTPVGDQTGNTIPKETLQSFEDTRNDIDYAVSKRVSAFIHNIRYKYDADYRKTTYQNMMADIRSYEYRLQKEANSYSDGIGFANKMAYQSSRLDNTQSNFGIGSITFAASLKLSGDFETAITWGSVGAALENGAVLAISKNASKRISKMDANLVKNPSFNMETPLQEMLRTSSPYYLNANNLRLVPNIGAVSSPARNGFFRSPNSTYLPDPVASRNLSKWRERMLKDPEYKLTVDCSEPADALWRASNYKEGSILFITSKSSNNGRKTLFNIKESHGTDTYYHHWAYVDKNNYVYDPLISGNPIPKGDYIRYIKSANETGTIKVKELTTPPQNWNGLTY